MTVHLFVPIRSGIARRCRGRAPSLFLLLFVPFLPVFHCIQQIEQLLCDLCDVYIAPDWFNMLKMLAINLSYSLRVWGVRVSPLLTLHLVSHMSDVVPLTLDVARWHALHLLGCSMQAGRLELCCG